MAGYKNPTPPEFVDAANVATCKIIEKLYAQGWKEGAEKVDVYTVNVPVRLSFLTRSAEFASSFTTSTEILISAALPRDPLLPHGPVHHDAPHGLRLSLQAPRG